MDLREQTRRNVELAQLAGLCAMACVVSSAAPTWASGELLRLRSGEFRIEGLDAPDRAGAEMGPRRAVVRFGEPVGEAEWAAIEAAGVELGQYLGNGAYVVRGEPGAVRTLASGPGIAAARWFTPKMKLDAELGARAFQTEARRELSRAGRGVFRVSLFADTSDAEAVAARAAIDAMGDVRTYPSRRVSGNPVFTVEAPVALAGRMASLASVQFIEDAPEITYRNATARGVVQSGAVSPTPLHDMGLRGEGQILGVTDSGLDQDHCSFLTNPLWLDPVHGDGQKLLHFNGEERETFHGTHVSGTAVGNNGDGSDTRGHAYESRFVFSRTPGFTFTDLSDVFETASGQGARIHTNSWGDDSTKVYTALCRAIDAFMHEHEDDLVVFASTNQDDLRSPENAKNCLSVAASNDSPSIDSACRSPGGLTLDGRLKPDIFAPGCNILSALSNPSIGNCGTAIQTGTSMATPAVSGMAALFRQYLQEGFYPTGVATPGDSITPTGALLKALVLNSATGMEGVPDLPGASSAFLGWGRILAEDPVYFAGEARRLHLEDVRSAGGMVTGSVSEREIAVTGSSEPLRVTLVWTDPPPAPGAALALVNDLDLEVIGPGGTSYLGNVFTGGASAPGGAADTLNNVEQVWIPSPGVGTWTVRVTGSSIPEGPQGYGLVVTGETTAPVRPLTVAAVDPPTLIAPADASASFAVVIDEGDDTLAPGSPTLWYRYAGGGAFRERPLIDAGGSVWRADLPLASCGHAPEFYVTAEGLATGQASSPVGLAGVALSALVGETFETELFREGFTTGLPPGWALDGLWSVTTACERAPVCEQSPWAYFGSAGAGCSFGVGGAVSGSLTSPAIALPALGPGERLTLRYCSSMENEDTSRFDLGKVLIDGVEVDQAPNTDLAWETREVDISSFAGTSATIEFFFDTIDSVGNGFGGWQVDDVRVVHVELECVDPCPGDLDGDGDTDVFDYAVLAVNFGAGPGTTREEGDITGDGYVDIFDFGEMMADFGCGTL
jgi:hypothetical protein